VFAVSGRAPSDSRASSRDSGFTYEKCGCDCDEDDVATTAGDDGGGVLNCVKLEVEMVELVDDELVEVVSAGGGAVLLYAFFTSRGK